LNTGRSVSDIHVRWNFVFYRDGTGTMLDAFARKQTWTSEALLRPLSYDRIQCVGNSWQVCL